MSIKDTVVLKKGKWEAGVCARLGGNAIYLKTTVSLILIFILQKRLFASKFEASEALKKYKSILLNFTIYIKGCQQVLECFIFREGENF